MTGGYVPKKKFMPEKGDFGGIYMGDDDDEVGDEDLDDFDVRDFGGDIDAGTMTMQSLDDNLIMNSNFGSLTLSSPSKLDVLALTCPEEEAAVAAAATVL